MPAIKESAQSFRLMRARSDLEIADHLYDPTNEQIDNVRFDTIYLPKSLASMTRLSYLFIGS